MLDFSKTTIRKASVHHVGNKTNGEEIHLSKTELDLSDVLLKELLQQYFLPPFNGAELYNFTFTNGDFNLNPLFSFSADLFDNIKSFHTNSRNIAKHLYEVSIHPQIKSGDLFVAAFTEIVLDDELVNAIGIFKSENRQAFLKVDTADNDLVLNYNDGINIDKLDKGCLIFNTEKSNGYKICIVDKANKSAEAQYWKDSFLMLQPCNDNYHQTKEFLDITKQYVTKQLTEDFEVNRTEQIDILNRSMDYFKTRDSFDKKDFEKEVFQDPDIIKSFRKFDDEYRSENEIEVTDRFEISPMAVKKQSRIFKSVLKLDKNFHIYIHGNKEMIERGIEQDGRKYYKIYYENET